MDNVKVKKTDLLKVLTENLDNHETEYTEAIMNWRTAVKIQLKARTKAFEKDDDANLFITCEKPLHHKKEYDHIICMVTMSVDDVIELDSQQFSNYVMDNWAWALKFKQLATMYSGTNR